MAEALPREAARLFVAPLAGFVKARDALAVELRAAGRTAEAAGVKRLRKPSPAVWAINQAALADRTAVTRFIDSVNRLKRAHFGPALLARATADHRSALDRLVEGARAALAGAGVQSSAAVAGRISTTLVGAAADPVLSADLRDGRLTQEARAPGFEALAGFGKASRPKKEPDPERPRAAERSHAVQRARDILHVAESEARDARRRTAEAERMAAQSRQAAARASDDVEDLKRRLREAEQRARDERRAAEQAADVARRARREAEDLEGRQRKAERALDAAQRRSGPR